jgi:hypothetical protein
LRKNSGNISFESFGINVCLGDDFRTRQSEFVVHRKSKNANRIFSGEVAPFFEASYLSHESSANQSSNTTQEQTEAIACASELDSLADEIAHLIDELEKASGQAEGLKEQLKEVSEEIESLSSDQAAIDLVTLSLMHFPAPLDSISWAAGVSKSTIARLVVDSLAKPTPTSILGTLLALTEFASVGWRGAEPRSDFADFINLNGLVSKDYSYLIDDVAAASFQEMIDAAEKERGSRLVPLNAEVDRLQRQLLSLGETKKSLGSSIGRLNEEKRKLEENLSASLRISLSEAGIFPKAGFSTGQILEEIAALTFTNPYEEGTFDVLGSVLQGKFNPNLVRALLSTFLNKFEDGHKTCCMNGANSCSCDPAESSRKEVENRLNLSWSEWKGVLNDRGHYCWPLNLLDHLSILKDMSNYYHHGFVMAHFLESMLAPSWATGESVVRNRINMPHSLSVQEEATLNSYLRQNYGFNRSDAIQTLMKEHQGLRGKSPREIMHMISFLVRYLGVEETGRRLAAFIRKES